MTRAFVLPCGLGILFVNLQEAGVTAGSHAKDAKDAKGAKGAKERDNRPRVMGQTSLTRGTPQLDAVAL